MVSWPIVLLGVALLAGCGQKGPLYLPTRSAAHATTTPVPAPAVSAHGPAAATTAAGSPADPR